MRNDENCSTKTVLLSFLVGGIVGAGIAMLLTPYSGPETRERLSGIKDDVLDKKDQYSKNIKVRVSDAVERGKEFIEEQKSALQSAVEAGREAFMKEQDEDRNA